jgi:hypothetical protein
MCPRALPETEKSQKSEITKTKIKKGRHSLKPRNIPIADIQMMVHASKGSDKRTLGGRNHNQRRAKWGP